MAAIGLQATAQAPQVTQTETQTETQAPELNGLHLNALSMNALSINGLQLNALSINGVLLNALSMNGLSYNGLTFNGLSYNALSMNGIEFNRLALNGLSYNGDGQLSHDTLVLAPAPEGTEVDGLNIAALELDGSFATDFEITQTAMIAQFETAEGESITRVGTELIDARLLLVATTTGDAGEAVVLDYGILSIDDVYPDPSDPNGPVLFYEISAVGLDDETHSPICENGSALIPIPGTWDHASGDRVGGDEFVTLACRGGVLAKCTEWGYRPWGETTSCAGNSCNKVVELADVHQACTRMARADYCGDGTPHTQNGTPIDVYDDLGPAINVSDTNWGVEAEWGPDGAVCLGDNFRYELVTDDVPSCFATLEHTPHCGELRGHRGMVANRYDN